jgi:hypothetical protein
MMEALKGRGPRSGDSAGGILVGDNNSKGGNLFNLAIGKTQYPEQCLPHPLLIGVF